MPDVIGVYTTVVGGDEYAPGTVVPIATMAEAESLVQRGLARWPDRAVEEPSPSTDAEIDDELGDTDGDDDNDPEGAAEGDAGGDAGDVPPPPPPAGRRKGKR